jgi:mannose-6-phosphate isomerase-like protein (cupin superfamily)
MAKKIREFMTHREPPEHIWMERDESAVIGTARMGQRSVPRIRPFDLLRSTPLSGNRARVTVFEGDSLRVATEHIAGCETQLTRAADHDLVYLQFCGRSKIESESGVVDVEPGEIVLVPAAISHRSTGTEQCLRVRVATQECVTEGVDPEKPTMQREFAVRPSEPIGFVNGGKPDSDGQGPVLEHISFWDPSRIFGWSAMLRPSSAASGKAAASSRNYAHSTILPV